MVDVPNMPKCSSTLCNPTCSKDAAIAQTISSEGKEESQCSLENGLENRCFQERGKKHKRRLEKATDEVKQRGSILARDSEMRKTERTMKGKRRGTERGTIGKLDMRAGKEKGNPLSRSYS
ncbi:hypothetical protein H6P81_000246 [Aristolochia fimbriata]|uniref:Uncharacterized protein n=1 Tax=Aristolochia fimbriata TaxID=158543 RepID=A0AAV7F3T9_ARIFI|nr:hypothetical protein H6P81_000246 [Aristolochia fimbriata]